MGQYTVKKPDSIKRRKRVGIGPSSGHGKTSCRGHNGQMSRSGSTRKPWFEGGQMPLQRRIPKRGFNNIFRKEYQLVNVSQLEKLNAAEVTPLLLQKAGLIDKADNPVKILGKGDFKISVKVTADAFSKGAMDKIKAAGGEANLRIKE